MANIRVGHRRPLTFIILVGGEELKSRQLKQSAKKTTIKVQITGRIASIGISDVVTVSVYSEKIRMKKLMMI